MYREFTACVRTGVTATQTVTIRQRTAEGARQRLLQLGYLEVLWVL